MQSRNLLLGVGRATSWRRPRLQQSPSPWYHTHTPDTMVGANWLEKSYLVHLGEQKWLQLSQMGITTLLSDNAQ